MCVLIVFFDSKNFEKTYPLPKAIRDSLDPLPMIYTRKHIHEELAIAAKFGNARAYYHLSEIFWQFSADCNPLLLQNWAVHLKCRAIQKGEGDVVLQSWLYKEKELLSGTVLHSDVAEGERLYYVALSVDDPIESMNLLRESSTKGFKLAHVEIGRRQPTPELAMQVYRECEHPDALFYAANLSDEEDAEVYYLKAGLFGKMQSYLHILQKSLDTRCLQKARIIAKMMADAGDFTGFTKIGDYFLKTGEKKHALKYYEKAGISGLAGLHKLGILSKFDMVYALEKHFDKIVSFLA